MNSQPVTTSKPTEARRAESWGRWLRHACVVTWVLCLAACASIPTFSDRRAFADEQARQKQWESAELRAGTFDLITYWPRQFASEDRLTVYIEGDGLAWISSDFPSSDPTPRLPTGLLLALAQPSGNAAYLGRPCQYVDARVTACAQRYWTQARFADKVIQSVNLAVSQLKVRFGAQRITLVGYSGGAAVAALVAARRDDVERLVTVAGNLDHPAWTKHHHVQPLSDSLNAMDYRERLSNIRQWHFVGRQDRVIPPFLVEHFASGMAEAHVITMDSFDHECCWAKHWHSLWKQVQ